MALAFPLWKPGKLGVRHYARSCDFWEQNSPRLRGADSPEAAAQVYLSELPTWIWRAPREPLQESPGLSPSEARSAPKALKKKQNKTNNNHNNKSKKLKPLDSSRVWPKLSARQVVAGRSVSSGWSSIPRSRDRRPRSDASGHRQYCSSRAARSTSHARPV